MARALSIVGLWASSRVRRISWAVPGLTTIEPVAFGSTPAMECVIVCTVVALPETLNEPVLVPSIVSVPYEVEAAVAYVIRTWVGDVISAEDMESVRASPSASVRIGPPPSGLRPEASSRTLVPSMTAEAGAPWGIAVPGNTTVCALVPLPARLSASRSDPPSSRILYAAVGAVTFSL